MAPLLDDELITAASVGFFSRVSSTATVWSESQNKLLDIDRVISYNIEDRTIYIYIFIDFCQGNEIILHALSFCIHSAE